MKNPIFDVAGWRISNRLRLNNYTGRKGKCTADRPWHTTLRATGRRKDRYDTAAYP